MHKFLLICALAGLTGGAAFASGAAAKQKDADRATNFYFTQAVLGKEWKLAAVTKGGADIGFSRDTLGEDRSGFYTLRFTVGAPEADADQAAGGADQATTGTDQSATGTDQAAEGAAKQVSRISGQAAPNRYFTEYQQNGYEVSFGLMASTKIFAFNEPETLKEHTYLTYLQGVNRWTLTEDGLELYSADPDGTAVVLRFAAE